MSIEGERPIEFPFEGERATQDEINTMERWAEQLSEFGFATVHRQLAVATDDGDAIFFKTLRHEGDAEGLLHTSLGVTKGGYENVKMRLLFNPAGELIDDGEGDSDDDWEASLDILRQFMADDEYDGELRQMIGTLHDVLTNRASQEVTLALLKGKQHTAVGVRSMHDYIRDLIADHTQFETRTGEWHEVLDEHNVVSIYSHDVRGDDIDDEFRAETGFAPLTVIYEDRLHWRKYLYIAHYGGLKTLQIQDMTVEDEADYIEVEDEEAAEAVAALYAPTSADVRLMTEKLQEAAIRIRNFSSRLDDEIMDQVQIGGANLLMDEMANARSAPDYLLRLISYYNNTELFETMKTIARTFGMFEMGSDPEYGKKAEDAIMKGLLLGQHVAANSMPEEALHMIDMIKLDDLTLSEGTYDTDHEVYDATDDTVSRAMLYYTAAETFHPVFDAWEDRLCTDIHFQKYLKRGFGLMLSVMDQASKLYSESVEKEMDRMREAPESIDFEDAIAEIELFLSEQPPRSE